MCLSISKHATYTFRPDNRALQNLGHYYVTSKAFQFDPVIWKRGPSELVYRPGALLPQLVPGKLRIIVSPRDYVWKVHLRLYAAEFSNFYKKMREVLMKKIIYEPYMYYYENALYEVQMFGYIFLLY